MNILDKEIRNMTKKWEDRKLDEYDFILLLPDIDVEHNSIIKSAFYNKLMGRRGIIIEDIEANEFVKLYELYEFSDKVIIGSFCKPYGRKLCNMLKCGLADRKVLIEDVILGAM